MNNRFSILNVIKLAGAYIAFSIGSGFATGQEVMQFFTAFGFSGIIGALVSMLLFAGLGAILMAKGYNLKLKTQTTAFRYYCGKHLGFCLEIFTVVFLFCVVSIMIAGTGAVTGEYFNVNPKIGAILMTAACIITVLMGLKRMVDVVGMIGPIITVFTILIGVATLANFGHLPSALTDFQVQQLFQLRATGGWWFSQYKFLDTAWFSGLLYAACMILGAIPFLSGLGASANSKREAVWGGILGGVFLMLPVILIVLSMLCYPDKIAGLEVPLLYLASKNAPVLALIFSIILLLGIYSTGAPMFWLVINWVSGFISSKNLLLILTLVLGVIDYFGASIGFGNLISILYPFAGQIGIIMIPVILFKGLKGQSHIRNIKIIAQLYS